VNGFVRLDPERPLQGTDPMVCPDLNQFHLRALLWRYARMYRNLRWKVCGTWLGLCEPDPEGAVYCEPIK
jgi:hypothetical protein